MATFALHAYPNGDRGQLLPKKASGVVKMGVLVVKGATAGSVSPSVSASTGSQPMGVTIYDEVVDADNSSPYYASGKPVQIETLKSGMVLNLVAAEDVTEGAICEAGADGNVRLLGASSTAATNFMANEAISSGDRGEFIVL